MSTFLEPHPSIKSLPPKQTIKVREWVRLQSPAPSDSPTIKLMTWNMLAQTLVRRELFPSSDCLKASQRGGLLAREVLTYNPDIACLQEVDRLEKQLPIFRSAGYSHSYASGPQKLHGCMIIWKSDLFDKVAEQTILYDEVDVNSVLYGDDGERPKRVASTRLTKNIGLILALARKDNESKGCIVATTHTFWHPKFTYERARQIGILVNTVRRLQASDERYRDWPAYLAGDFNTQPTEASYSLLTAQPLTPAHVKSVSDSRVIHISLDPSVPPTPDVKEDEGGSAAPQAEGTAEKENDKGNDKEKEATDPDRIITNSRRAVPSDDLLSDEELRRLYGFEEGKGLRSGYDEALRVASAGAKDNVFGGRVQDAMAGVWEPTYTSYTFFWKLTLDYIFFLDAPGVTSKTEILGVLKPHTKEDMEPGLPKAGICGSDHTSLMLELRNAG
ncbi:hypothetical protein FRB90_001737 [Tulasnella sp. 427]|nr:hypothetical protein FRB90_001737 [Tulasnella sp. 427]